MGLRYLSWLIIWKFEKVQLSRFLREMNSNERQVHSNEAEENIGSAFYSKAGQGQLPSIKMVSAFYQRAGQGKAVSMILPALDRKKSHYKDRKKAQRHCVNDINALLIRYQEAKIIAEPPRCGERILLLILSKEERINIPGDLTEEFAQIAAKHGARFAKIWYYKQVVGSAWPMIQKAIRWGLLVSAWAWVRRLI